MSIRKPFPQFNKFRDFVIDEFRRRKSLLSSTPTNTPFIRMSSTLEDSDMDYRFFSLGLHGFGNADISSNGKSGFDSLDIFDLTYGTGREVVGHGYSIGKTSAGRHKKKFIYADDISFNVDAFSNQLSSNFTLEDANALGEQKVTEQKAKVVPAAAHPMPGITNMTLSRHGLLGPFTAQVSWNCYNQGQLEFLRNHFLISGNFIILEYGTQSSNKQIVKTLDFKSDHTELYKTLQNVIGAVDRNGPALEQIGREYIISNYVEPNNGNYDFIVGKISNFQIEFEPESGIYKCTTHIVSQGENLTGVSINRTYVEAADPQPDNITTIAEYFTKSKYDEFLSRNQNNGFQLVTGKIWKDGKINEDKIKDLGKISENPNDYAYISWNLFAKDLITDMLSVIKNSSIQEELQAYLKIDEFGPNDFIGYHPILQTTEPESMLLITDNLVSSPSLEQMPLLQQNPFRPYPEAENAGGRLNEGVWINTQAIREAFTTSQNMYQAIFMLLNKMNQAVANYWKLQLFYDEELVSYKVVDAKFDTQHRSEQFYKFNVGGAGECLHIEFDSAFSPEIITLMNTVARFDTMTPEQRNELIGKVPLLGTTSAHALMMNWSYLKDGLQSILQLWREKNKPIASNDTLAKLDLQAVPSTALRVMPIEAGRGTPQALGSNVNKTPQAGVADNTVMTNVSRALPPTSNPDRSGLKVITPPVAPGGKLSGQKAYVNRNPGNVKLPHTKADASGFTIFDTPEQGYQAVVNQLAIFRDNGTSLETDPITKQQLPAHTLSQVIDSYDRTFIDPNTGTALPPRAAYIRGYINEVAEKLRVSPNIAMISVNLNEMAQAICYRESKSTIIGNAFVPAQGTKIRGQNSSSTVHKIGPTPHAAQTALEVPPSQKTIDVEFEDFSKLTPDQRREKEIKLKFGDGIINLMYLNKSIMVNLITHDGYVKGTVPNSFVSPYPTTTAVTVTIQGIAGISITDGFFVDKLPFLFERHGVFQVTEITESVMPNGWTTKIRGLFKMLWYDGDGDHTQRKGIS